MKVLENINYAGLEDEARQLDVYIPEGQVKGTLIFFHGGGLDHGTRKIASEYLPIVEAGYAFISADYRLFPNVHYPAFLEDAAQAIEFSKEMAPQWGIPAEMFVSGASAGAWQIMMLAMDRTYLKNDDFVKGYISESAQVFAHYGILQDRGFDGRLEIIDDTAPIGYIKEGLQLRPLVLLTYTDDVKCRPEENRLMYASLIKMLPDNIVDYGVLEGTHLHPVRNEDRVQAYLAFMDKLA